ncbi:MAG: pilus assembly protein [Proteobacteria bacterium]|nr:pilus assembly protein [Pseudomonadota bacterium]
MFGRLIRSNRGVAALEAALLLPVLAGLFYLLVVGAGALITHSSLSEASSVAARQVLMTGESSHIPDLVNALLPALDPSDIVTTVTFEDAGSTVTVEVTYEYRTLLDGNPLSDTSSNLLTLVASTSMPVP